MSVVVETSPQREIPSIAQPHRFTVAEYHRMAGAGVFSESSRVELLEGEIVDKMTRNPPHDFVLQRLNRWLARVLPAEWDWRIQSAITLADSEPESDVAIVRVREHGYKMAHPAASDTALVIEIAEASLREDQTRKPRIYASAGIAEYWIFNLPDACVETYSEPNASSYKKRSVLRRGRMLTLSLGDKVVREIAVDELLP